MQREDLFRSFGFTLLAQHEGQHLYIDAGVLDVTVSEILLDLTKEVANLLVNDLFLVGCFLEIQTSLHQITDGHSFHLLQRQESEVAVTLSTGLNKHLIDYREDINNILVGTFSERLKGAEKRNSLSTLVCVSDDQSPDVSVFHSGEGVSG